jgi:gluconate 2-dehydrogenase gamma chain
VDRLSRRQFLARSAAYGGALWVSLSIARPRALAAAAASSEPAVLTPSQWSTLEAIAARIIPSDATPGALEAGCVNFIDKALAHEDAEMRPLYSEGLDAIDACAHARHGKTFAELSDADRDALLIALQDGACPEWSAKASSHDFFELVRVHTVMGFLADPVHGGNRDYAGWKLVGYPGASHHRGGYTPAQMIGEDQKIATVWEPEE